jgi:beclin 1
MGSFSRIEKTTGDKSSYELYCSGNLNIVQLLHNRRFDLAMVAFLECLKEVMDYVRSQDSTVEFPHQYVSRENSIIYVDLGVKDCQGQDWRCFSQVEIQSGRSLDAITTTCSFGAENLPEMGD